MWGYSVKTQQSGIYVMLELERGGGAACRCDGPPTSPCARTYTRAATTSHGGNAVRICGRRCCC